MSRRDITAGTAGVLITLVILLVIVVLFARRIWPEGWLSACWAPY